MTSKVDVVEKALATFLQKHETSSSSSLLDEIVLNYVAGIVDDISLLDTDNTGDDDSFDVEDFVEMMDAYLPGFAQIPSKKVQDWMFQLAKSFRESQKDLKPTNLDSYTEECSVKQLEYVPSSMAQGKSIPVDIPSPPPIYSAEMGDKHDEAVSVLLEMFPASCQVEVQHCLGVAGGNVDEAAELVLYRQLSGESITNSLHSLPPRRNDRTGSGDEDMKQKIVNKYMYSYVDGAETSGGPRSEPKMTLSVAQKKEPKKLVRYLDGKVVNTKGQRFTDVKKPESEDMKKTYINLKPAKQYRFH